MGLISPRYDCAMGVVRFFPASFPGAGRVGTVGRGVNLVGFHPISPSGSGSVRVGGMRTWRLGADRLDDLFLWDSRAELAGVVRSAGGWEWGRGAEWARAVALAVRRVRIAVAFRLDGAAGWLESCSAAGGRGGCRSACRLAGWLAAPCGPACAGVLLSCFAVARLRLGGRGLGVGDSGRWRGGRVGGSGCGPPAGWAARGRVRLFSSTVRGCVVGVLIEFLEKSVLPRTA